MRTFRTVALGATLLALLVGACSSGGSSPSPSAASAPPETSAPSEPAAESPSAPAESPSAPAGPALSTTLKLGGPPECPERPFCLLGLTETYGLEFAEFVPLDPGGPLTVQALTGGNIDVGLLFTSDAAIATNGFVLLEDDMKLQLADNIIPVVRQEVLEANPTAADLLNTVMSSLSQEELTNLNKAVTVDTRPVGDVATEWITAQNFDASQRRARRRHHRRLDQLPGAGDPGRDLRPDAREQRRDSRTQVPARQPRDRLPGPRVG